MRLYTSENIPLDFCQDCAPDETMAEIFYPGFNGHDTEHPPYDDPGMVYHCENCGKTLTDSD